MSLSASKSINSVMEASFVNQSKDQKILVLTTSYTLDYGIVASAFVAEQCETLTKKGYEVHVLCPHLQNQKRQTIINDVTVKRFKYFFPTKLQNVAYHSGIPTNLRNSYLARLQLPFFIIAFVFSTWKHVKKTQLIYAHWTIPALIGIIIKKISRDKKVIFMNHGAEIFVLGKNYFGKKIIRFILNNSDFIISNSSFTFLKTQELLKSENHKIISPGFDDKKFYPTSLNFKNKFNLSDDSFILFSLGNFIERKGFEYLIKAMHILVNQLGIRKIISIIGGKGSLLEKYQAMISEHKLEKYILLPGYIKQEEVVIYYNTCHVFVHPAIIDRNHDTEGLGVVLTEANACGKPVIASKVGGITDVVVHDFNGLLVDEKNEQQLANAILQLMEDQKLRERMGMNARTYALEHFTWETNVNHTIAVFNQVLAKHVML